MLKWRFLLGVTFLWPDWLELEIKPQLIGPLCEWVIKCPYGGALTASENTVLSADVRSAGFPLQDSWWPGRGSPAETFKVVVIDMQRVLDQWLGWHIHWQARYYSSATVLQIVFQVLGISRVTLEAFMSLVRVGPSVCHQCRGSLPAEQEERGHGDLVVLAWEECEATAKRCHTKLELMVSSFFFFFLKKTENFLKAVFFCVY